MGKGPSTFKKIDVKRSIVAAQMAGLEAGRVEIGKDGTVVIIPRGQNAAPTDEWDRALDQIPAQIRS